MVSEKLPIPSKPFKLWAATPGHEMTIIAHRSSLTELITALGEAMLRFTAEEQAVFLDARWHNPDGGHAVVASATLWPPKGLV